MIIMSDVAVDLLMDELTDIIRGVRTNIDVDSLANVFVGVITAFDIVIPDPLEDFRC